MKKIIMFFLVLNMTSYVFAKEGYYDTIEKAAQNCPSINALTFVPHHSDSSYGKVKGRKGDVDFQNATPHQAFRPKNLSDDNLILNANFRKVGNAYGYEIGNLISCFYKYTNYLNSEAALILHGNRVK